RRLRGLAVVRHGGVAVVGRDFGERVQRFARLRDRITGRLLQLHEDLFAVHVDRTRRLDPETNLVPAYFENGDDDVVTDHDALICTPREHEHGVLPPWHTAPCERGQLTLENEVREAARQFRAQCGRRDRCRDGAVTAARAGVCAQLATASGARNPYPIAGTTTCAASCVRRLMTTGPTMFSVAARGASRSVTMQKTIASRASRTASRSLSASSSTNS